MRKLLSFAVIGLVTLAVAVTASARPYEVVSTVGTKLGFGKVGTTTATGVVTVNSSNSGIHLDTLRLAPTDPADSSPAPVTDPETTGTIASNIVDGAVGAGGVFAPISGAAMSQPLTQNVLALGGIARVCLVLPGCGSSLPLILTTGAGTTQIGVGIGGTVTVGFPGPVRISLVNSPWQLKTATRLQSTANGVVITRMHHGFVHGPASNTSSTAKASGVVQLITPIQVLTKGIAGNSTKIALFTSIALHFVPEPGLMLLLGSGVVGLALLGRSRMRK
jgi:hypothetical protein